MRINGIAQLNLDTKVPASLSPIGDNVIEVDGIQLETLVPERVLTIPINERSAYATVRFGVRLTNKTLMPMYFSWGSFKPELIRLNGEVIPLEPLQISIVLLREFDFPLVMPQESVTLFWEGKLNWGNNEIQLQLPDRYSRLWYFRGFQPGVYKIRFTYSFSSATEILDFPVGEDTEFAVTVGNVLLGTFGPGSSIDFVSLLGHPVNNFKITGISSLIGATAETAFPIQLAFDKPEGSFQMRAFSEEDAEEVPEPTTVLGALLALTGLGTIKSIKNRK